MQLLSILPIACGLLPAAIADFVIVTDVGAENLPTPPPSITGTDALSSWYSSVASEIEAATVSWASAQGSSYQIAHDSAMSEFSAFAATATYSIDASALEPSGDPEAYTTVPDWFSALPKDVQQQKEYEASVQLSIYYDVLSSASGTPATVDASTASGTASSAPASTKASATGIPKSTNSDKSTSGSSTASGTSSTHSPVPTGGAASTGLEGVKFGLATIAAAVGVLLVL